MRVLLIEDEPTTAKAIELMLSSEGFNVYTTDLGEEGVDLGKIYDYDLILLDLNLPDVTGLEGLIRIRAAVGQVPVVVVSSLADNRVIGAALRAGAAGFIPKHSRREVFRAAFEAPTPAQIAGATRVRSR